MNEEKGQPTCPLCGAEMSIFGSLSGGVAGHCRNEDCMAVIQFKRHIVTGIIGRGARTMVDDMEEYMRRFLRRPGDQEHMEGT